MTNTSRQPQANLSIKYPRKESELHASAFAMRMSSTTSSWHLMICKSHHDTRVRSPYLPPWRRGWCTPIANICRHRNAGLSGTTWQCTTSTNGRVRPLPGLAVGNYRNPLFCVRFPSGDSSTWLPDEDTGKYTAWNRTASESLSHFDLYAFPRGC